MVVNFPIQTGQVSMLLGCKERRLQEAVRQQIVRPEVIAGRRLWRPIEVLTVAAWLGLDTPEIKSACLERLEHHGLTASKID